MAIPGRRLVVASTFLLLLSVLVVGGTEEIDQRIVVVLDKTFDISKASQTHIVKSAWPDGLTYIMWKDETFTFAEMKAYCAKIPYFRVTILKTSMQFQFVNDTIAPLSQGVCVCCERVSE
ncbi:hypothetical protein Pmani_003578 [Petrolisthes manimaculis]|uniref:Uncharacterized protein n=1 Tax=Petrolisthes manimaculis TaxID=1843537 RepID=A0AAE1QG15_9EUCA|nr:hypothetical protein Pmani_003578 [Petrolisthes manimaculis]